MRIAGTMAVGAALVFCASVEARAVGLLAPPVKEGTAEIALQVDVRNTVEYEASEAGQKYDLKVERRMFSACGGYESFFIAAGIITDSDPRISGVNVGVNGNGFVVGAGARASVWKAAANKLFLYGQVSYLKEEYDVAIVAWDIADPVNGASSLDGACTTCGGGIAPKLRLTSTELLLGGVLTHTLENITFYGGVELYPYSDTKLTEEGGSGYWAYGPSELDVDRTHIFGLKAGAIAELNGFEVNLDIQLLGTESIRLGVGRRF